jgi:hypothetical protein
MSNLMEGLRDFCEMYPRSGKELPMSRSPVVTLQEATVLIAIGVTLAALGTPLFRWFVEALS